MMTLYTLVSLWRIHPLLVLTRLPTIAIILYLLYQLAPSPC